MYKRRRLATDEGNKNVRTLSHEWLIVRSLNAKFEPDRDKADKSAKLCIQFRWDMSMKSEMGAQGKKLPVTI